MEVLEEVDAPEEEVLAVEECVEVVAEECAEAEVEWEDPMHHAVDQVEDSLQVGVEVLLVAE